MVTAKIKELEATKAKVAALEKSISAELNKELAALPAKFGFDTVQDFIAAVKSATGGRKTRGRPAAAGGGQKRRKRAVITEATRAQVKVMVQSGKTGAAIAKSLGISLPSVQNIKKALGLVQARKKR